MPKRNHHDSVTSEESASGGLGEDSMNSSSSAVSTRKRKRVVTLTPIELCLEIYDKIRNFKTSEGRLLCEYFIRVPNKRAAAEYYETVKQPIDMLKIQNKIKSEEYENVDQFQADLDMLVSNAKSYFRPTSQEFEDACELWEVFLRERQVIESGGNLPTNGGERRSRRYRRAPPVSDDGKADDEESDRMSVAASEESHNASESGYENPQEAYFAAIVSHIMEDGTELAPTFALLPSKKAYPQYYDVIPEPIDLHTIAQRVLNGGYTTLDDMDKDLFLMVRNAKNFNEPKSIVYQHAMALSKWVKLKRHEIDHSKSSKTSGRIRFKRSSQVDVHSVTEEFATMEPIVSEESADTTLEEVRMSTDEGEDTEDENVIFESVDPRHNQMILYKSVMNYKNNLGHNISTPFIKLPSKTVYADYYVEIKNPLSLANIRSRIKKSHYTNLNDLACDFDLVFNNAQQYNLEDSVIFKDAVKLQKFMRNKKDDLQSTQPQEDFSDDLLRPLVPQTLPVILPHFFQKFSPGKERCGLEFVLSEVAQSNYVPTLRNPMGHRLTEQEGMDSDSMKQSNNTSQMSTSVLQMTPEMAHMRSSTGSAAGAVDSPVMTAGMMLMDTTPIRRVPGGRKPLSPEEIKNKRLSNLYKCVYNYQENNRFLREIFMVLPSRNDYPDYYDVIVEPIDLTMIRKKIDDDKYTCHQELVADLRLMFKNARHYNEEGSQVFKDAVVLENVVKKKLKNLGPSGLPSSRRTSVLVNSNGGSPRVSGSPLHLQASPLQRKLAELYFTLKEYRDSNGRVLSGPFLKLPTRQEMPQYYEFIKRPIEMLTIGAKLQQTKYGSLEELIADFILMFDNACKFNEPESMLYKDALTLQRVCLEKKSVLLLDEPSDRIPDVRGSVQELMTSILAQIVNHTDEEGRCLSDSLAEVPCPVGVLMLTLDRVKINLDRGRYRRIDRFQEDMFSVFRHARKTSRLNSQVYEDALELQRMFITIRDNVCRRGELLLTPALSYTEKQLEGDLESEKDQRADSETPSSFAALSMDDEMDKGGESDVEIKQEDKKPAGLLKHVTVRGVTYCQHDFVHIEPMNSSVTDFHIARIQEVIPPSSPPAAGEVATPSQQQTMIRVNWYYRPTETFHNPRRRFLQQEVFMTKSLETVPIEKIAGRCHIMYVKEFFKRQPKNVPEKDVYVCESQYSIRTRNFMKIKVWPLSRSPSVELQDRATPLLPVRIHSVFAKNSDAASTATPVVAPMATSVTDLLSENSDDTSIIDKPKQNVIQEDKSATEATILYDQYVQENGLCVKLGDFVYLRNTDSQGKPLVIRIDSIWKNTVQNVVYISGPAFMNPLDVEHLPTRVFFKKEVFLKSSDPQDHLLTAVTSKCVVLAYSDYCAYRPTEYSEDDVFLCESKYFTDEKAIRKLKKGLKKFQLSPDVCDDEIFFFRKSITPRKEPSPLLFQASQEPISYEFISNPPTYDEDTRDFLLSGSVHDDSMSASSTASTHPGDRVTKKSKKLRKPPSGYVVFAGEIRKQLLRDRPDAPFGEISKEVGQMWRNLPQENRDTYEKRAQIIKKQMEEQMAIEKAHQAALEAARPTPPPTPAPQPHHQIASVQMPGGRQGNVQFYQTNNGQLVQVVHSTAGPTTDMFGQQQPQQLVYQFTGGAGGQPTGGAAGGPGTQLLVATQMPGGGQQLMAATRGPGGVAMGPGGQPQPVTMGQTLVQSGGQLVTQGGGAGQAPGQVQVLQQDLACFGDDHHPGGMMLTGLAQPPGSYVMVSDPSSLQSGAGTTGMYTHAHMVPQSNQHQFTNNNCFMAEGPVSNIPLSSMMSQVNAVVPPPRTPSPVFVSVAPRTARTLHSDIYQRYIDRLRKNADHLSDWPKQLSASKETTPLAPPIQARVGQIAGNFLSRGQEHHDSVVDALWSLRDHLLKDALNIRTRLVGFEEM